MVVDWIILFFFFSSRRRHTRFDCDWSSDVCSSDLRNWRRLERHDAVVEQRRSQKPGDDQLSNFQTGKGRTFLRTHLRSNPRLGMFLDRKSTRLNSSHSQISYAVFCLKKKNNSQCAM